MDSPVARAITIFFPRCALLTEHKNLCRARRMFQSFSIWRYTEAKKGPIKMLSAVGRSKSSATDSETGLVMTKRALSQTQQHPHTHLNPLPFLATYANISLPVRRPCFKICKHARATQQFHQLYSKVGSKKSTLGLKRGGGSINTQSAYEF